jgi:uncharacterized membrane protein
MLKTRRQLRLANEAAFGVVARNEQLLDRHGSIQAAIMGQQHASQTASRMFCSYFILSGFDSREATRGGRVRGRHRFRAR